MPYLLALILGVVQGLTEFLPISSSGHLTLIQALFGIEGDHHAFDLACHIGSLGAILILLRHDLKNLICKDVILATLPLFLIPFFKSQLMALYGKPYVLSCCFFLTALLLYAGERWGRVREHGSRGALTVGLMQAISILPGISRSGSTISSARLMGWDLERAVRFSFLLAIPAILGGAVLEASSLIKVDLLPCLIGLLTSFVTGLLGLAFFLRLVKKRRLIPFVWYCLAIGTISLFVL